MPIPADASAPHPGGRDADIVVLEDVWGPPFDTLAERFGVVAHRATWDDREELLQVIGPARGLVVRNRTQVDRDLLERAERLVVVGRAGVGLDNIDLKAADDLGVVVVSAPGANARSVAELAVGLALVLARDVVGHDRRVRLGLWERTQGWELSGATWGVVGLGATGRAVAGAARSLGMRVVGHDPFSALRPPEVDEVATTLTDLLARSDVVSLHLALSPESSGLVDADFLAAMRPGALLINVARGGLVDEEALADALDSGHLGGAALDVRANEPPVPGRLEQNEKVVHTPHVAGLTDQAQARVVEMLVGELSTVLDGAEAEHAAGRWRVPRRRPPTVSARDL
ncbi:MAG: hydroxyacid dehydrogenase [Acidimicrobiales bacterium]